MSVEYNYPGSRWWKFDFHVHSPKSNDYGRGDELIRRSTTAQVWLQSCMKAGLDCVAITDHNSGEWIGELQGALNMLEASDSKPDWYKPVTIFPGVEITVSLGTGRIHLLALFDPDTSDGNTITAVLGKCGITNGFGDERNTSTTKSFEETVEAVVSAGGIAIPAHIDGPKGLLEGITSLNHELERCLNKVYAAEFCDPHVLDDYENGLQNAVARLAILAGSDAHKPDEIGSHATWIKMSRPSIEGLRLALFDHEFCLNNSDKDPNKVPDIFVRSLDITSMRHCGRIPGQPFQMSFHPHFNALIGGRGSGKSTALESIRIAARRVRDLEETPKLKTELDSFMAHESKKGVMLNDTEIRICLSRRGIEYRLHWRFDSKGVVLEEKQGDDWSPCETGNLHERFSFNIYSQKQINELAANPKGLLEILDRSPQVNRTEWDQRWESMKNQFLQLRLRQREINQQLPRGPEIRTKLSDVENDLKRYEERGHGEILKNFQRRSQQLRAISLENSFDPYIFGFGQD